jgi:Zn-dependent M28 family amino/carboxypeptidase
MHQYSAPAPEDPWYTAYNLYAKKTGTELPDEIIVVISHKDSQSWIDSPGANDNCVGTVGNLAVARALAGVPTKRSVWFIFCNEEHTPWTSETAARNAAERGDKIVAVLNLDGLGVKSPERTAAGERPHVTAFSLPEGERLADVQAEVNEALGLGLVCSKVQREHPGDDDGSYVKAGYPAAAIIIGSFPYEDPNYHQPSDVAELVDIESAALSAKLVTASVLRIAEDGLGA